MNSKQESITDKLTDYQRNLRSELVIAIRKYRASRGGLATALSLVVSLAMAGPAPQPPPKPSPAPAPQPPAATAPKAEWQARLSAKVLEWMGESDLDYGFSIAYFRDPNHRGSIVGPLDDGRGLLSDPAAFATFPSQSALDLGLRIFLDQMDAKNGSIEAVLEALEQQGTVNILAEPTLVLKKGAGDATVRTGSRIPYAVGQIAGVTVAEVTEFKDTGVSLKVSFLDMVKLDHTYAKMKVVANVASLIGYVSVSTDPNGTARRVPLVNERRIENMVLIRDKTTLIAGIVKEDSEASNKQGPPLLGRIPYIKELVSNRSSTKMTREILFLLHVDLLPPEAM